MLNLQKLRDKTIIIVGMGKVGVAARQALADNQITYFIYDDSDRYNNDDAYKSTADIEQCDYDYLLLSPGINDQHILAKDAIKRDIPIITDLDILCLCYDDVRIIAVTGSNGKSTTTDLIAHALNEYGHDALACGNIGRAVLSLDDSDMQKILVIELSSYALARMKYTYFAQAILLNITPDHLEWHGSMENYIAAKARIFVFLRADGQAICGIGDEYCHAIYQSLTHHHKIPLTSDNTPHLSSDYLKGAHNQQNINGCFHALRYMSINDDDIKNAIASYQGLAHRQQYIGTYQGHRFINDSKATNGEASIHALRSFSNIFWLMGGAAKKGSDYHALTKELAQVKAIYIYGQDGDFFHDIFAQHCPCACFTDMNQAMQQIMQDITKQQQNITILLSPACASFDQFDNFEHRGDAFISLYQQFTKPL